MYTFTKIDYRIIDKTDYYNFIEKTPFTTVEWLDFLKAFRHIYPVVLKITDGEGDVGNFTGGIIHFIGIKVLGSPFYGWVCQHMGFDFRKNVNKSILLDELIDYAIEILGVQYIQITDLKYGYDILENCTHKLIGGERYKTCYIDLTKTEDELFKAFKSEYRTCVRKFEKNNCLIKEDLSDEFILEHSKQLKEVFRKQKMMAPNYVKKMKLMYNMLQKKNILLSIKAVTPDNINIASSYYIGFKDIAFLASNASYISYSNLRPNQALHWFSMRYWKSKGIRVMDMGGSGDYKGNYGAEWKLTPIIIFSKNKLTYFIIIGLKRSYYKFFRLTGKLKNWVLIMFHKNKEVSE